MAAAFAPAELWFLAPLALAVLFYSVAHAGSRRAAATLAFVFAFVWFGGGLHWIFGALGGYIGLPMWAAALLSAIFYAALSCYFAAAAALSFRFGGDSAQMATLVILAAAWAAAEWLRGLLFSGFPWLAAGYSQSPASPLHGWLPIFGINGANLFVALTAALLAALFPLRLQRALSVAMALFVLWGGGALAARMEWTRPAGEISVSLLQGNIRQELKWRAGEVEQALRDYARLAENAAGRWIIFPETALPMRLADAPEYVAALRSLAANRDGAVLLGAFVEDGEEWYNGAAALGDFPSADYRKRHLTPYGEYLPFAGILRPLLLAADIPYNSLAAGGAARAMSLPGADAAISICYEDIFPEIWRAQLPQAKVLINITNDGWFDGSAMSLQHLRMAQFRAAEFGRSLARATNTGMTALINHRGRVISQLPPMTRGELHGVLELRKGATPFMRYGETPALLLSAALAASALLRQRNAAKRRRFR